VGKGHKDRWSTHKLLLLLLPRRSFLDVEDVVDRADGVWSRRRIGEVGLRSRRVILSGAIRCIVRSCLVLRRHGRVPRRCILLLKDVHLGASLGLTLSAVAYTATAEQGPAARSSWNGPWNQLLSSWNGP
jgi:hypothetical protein